MYYRCNWSGKGCRTQEDWCLFGNQRDLMLIPTTVRRWPKMMSADGDPNFQRRACPIKTPKKLARFKNWEDVKQATGFRDGVIRRLQEAVFSLAGRSKAA